MTSRETVAVGAGLLVALGVAMALWNAREVTNHLGKRSQSPLVVVVEVGQDIQSIVDRHPPGTTYRIAAGVHREQSVVPDRGDHFVGEPGAVMSGARILDPKDFVERDGRYVITDQSQSVDPREPRMLEGHIRQGRPEELFADGRRLRHVEQRSDVDRSGTWWFDYDADEIWVFDDPADWRILETSVAPFAFRGSYVRDVVIRTLEVRQYASPAQGGAVDGTDSINWTVDAVAAIDNHATGIRVGPGMRVTRCLATGNGQLGVAGNGRTFSGPLVEGPVHVSSCTIRANQVLGYDWQWEAGGTKFSHIRGATFANNLVVGHPGPGVWFDIDSRDMVVCANRISDNLMGVFVETSSRADVYGNEVGDNRRGQGDDVHAAFYVSESQDVSIVENLAYDNVTGIRARQVDRDDSDLQIRGLEVRGNDLGFSAWTGLQVLNDDPGAYAPGRQHFADNVYRTDSAQPFRWEDGLMDFSRWQLLAHDAEGQVLPASTAPGPFPAGLDRYTEVTSGPTADRPEPDAASCAARPPR